MHDAGSREKKKGGPRVEKNIMNPADI